MRTPVVFLIFNRPDETARVFEKIRDARPPKLLVVADGPRPDRSGETQNCLATRKVIERVDWPCEVLTNYADVNLGCKKRVSSGLDWVFKTVPEAIILEDDCLPDPTFFRFCEELLERYRDDERVMMISGDNVQFGRTRTSYSYYFSRYAHIWGWASWRRAWKSYDVTMRLWPELRDGGWLRDILHDAAVEQYWHRIFEKVYRDEIDTWDYPWIFTCMANSGLIAMPNVNLISNIGYGASATHTTAKSIFAGMRTEPLSMPLSHPPFIIRDARADAFMEKEFFVASYAVRAKHKLKLFLDRIR